MWGVRRGSTGGEDKEETGDGSNVIQLVTYNTYNYDILARCRPDKVMKDITSKQTI